MSITQFIIDRGEAKIREVSGHISSQRPPPKRRSKIAYQLIPQKDLQFVNWQKVTLAQIQKSKNQAPFILSLGISSQN